MSIIGGMTSVEAGLSNEQAAAYLARIGISGRPGPSAETLRELQVQHLRTVPFENLSIHLGEPISLDPDDMYAKIVDRRRGGFCYELNGLFALLLRTLRFDVDLLSCSVHMNRGFGPPFDHMALLVGIPGERARWLADVGFGRHSAYPLRPDTAEDQDDPNGVFRLTTTPSGDIDVQLDGAMKYRTETRPRALKDFEPTCWWQQTAPASHFRAGPVCSRLTDTFGMITLAERTVVTTEDGNRTERTLDSDADVLATYEKEFGFTLERVPVPVSGDGDS